MQVVFAWEFRKQEPEDTLRYYLGEYAPKIKDDPFAYDLLRGVIKNKKKLIKKVEKYAPEWPYLKIASVDRAILLVGVWEILYSKDVPPVVAINEAIEVSKEYGSDNSSKFINGVLSAIFEAEVKNKKTKK